MGITIKTNPDDRVIELGGGANPTFRPNVDVRRCQDKDGKETVDLVADFNQPLPISSNEYDAVFSQFVIEHLSWRSVRRFVAEVHRIVKPGGRVCIVTANTEAQLRHVQGNQSGWDGRPLFESASCILFGDQDYPENTHRNYMSPSVVTALLQEAGFEKILVQPYGALGTDMVVQSQKPALV